MKRFKQLKVLAILSIITLAYTSACIAADLSIESDQQSFKMEENKATFTGNVKVKLDDIALGLINDGAHGGIVQLQLCGGELNEQMLGIVAGICVIAKILFDRYKKRDSYFRQAF